jgi:putative cardiolipin synthase
MSDQRNTNRGGQWAIFVLVATLVTACASVDFDYPRSPSTAIESEPTSRLAEQIEQLEDLNPGDAGFHLLTDSIDALAARLLMAARAERTLDAQYYLITDDEVGELFLDVLLEAADRGVRVRLLLDDIQTQGLDTGMAALDSHPHFEIRIFNPFAGRSTRIGDGITRFNRVNRRMHNKSFTVDNQVTVVGGRNIAGEYFGARSDVNFGDIDVMAVGPVVEEVSEMFDTYWNSRSALPLPAFAKMPEDPAAQLEALRQRIGQSREELESSSYAEVLTRDIQAFVEADASIYTWAPYEVVYDSPEKVEPKKAEEAESILAPLRQAVDGAASEILFVSPYFVPRKSGIRGFEQLIERGVESTVITNSLASTNHSIVHSGYAPARKPLLKLGVRLYEVRPDRGDSGAIKAGNVSAEGALHSKAFVVDRSRLFVGSFNLDPRSAYLNTELGIIIDSPLLATMVVEGIEQALPTSTYRVEFDEKGKLRWVGYKGGEKEIWKKEPQTSWWTRFQVSVMRILPIKGQL